MNRYELHGVRLHKSKQEIRLSLGRERLCHPHLLETLNETLNQDPKILGLSLSLKSNHNELTLVLSQVQHSPKEQK